MPNDCDAFPRGGARPLVSICLTCRDGREAGHGEVRGGTRFAREILAAASAAGASDCDFRGVRCMSQCKRPCVVSLSRPGAFTYLFGDLDPRLHAGEVIAVAALYGAAPEGFLLRAERPAVMRAGILGRIPPPETASDLVEPLILTRKQEEKTR